MRTLMAIANTIVLWILRSPAHRVLDGVLVGLTYQGRRSGVTRSLPVQYAAAGERIVVLPARAAGKTWWRNFLGGWPLEAQLRGRRRTGRAEALQGGDDAVEALRVFLARFPSAVKVLGLPTGPIDDETLRAAAAGNVVVVVDLDPG